VGGGRWEKKVGLSRSRDEWQHTAASSCSPPSTGSSPALLTGLVRFLIPVALVAVADWHVGCWLTRGLLIDAWLLIGTWVALRRGLLDAGL
jgi:hypothetical protein